MFKSFKLHLAVVMVFIGLLGGAVAATIPSASASAQCGGGFLTLPPWYRGVVDGECKITPPPGDEQGLTRYIWTIVLNVIEIVMQIIAYIAVAFIIYGGFLYMTSNGRPDAAAQGLKTIINATVGLALAVGAVAIKNLIWAVTGRSSTNDFGVYEVQASTVISAAFQTVYFIAGAVAVVMIIISSIHYITANGNPGAITKAKQTLLYSVIGLAVVIVAYPLTIFILERL